MAVISDGVTIGVVLLLLFGALFFYLWLRIQQVEKRGLLLENILLDLKLTTESTMGEFPEPAPAPATSSGGGGSKSAPIHVEEEEVLDSDSDYLSEVTPMVNVTKEKASEEDYTSVLDEVVASTTKSDSSVVTAVMPSGTRMGSSYESMTLKDLKTLAKTRKISGSGSLTRAQLIQQLKEKDDQASSLWGSTSISEEGTEGLLDSVVEGAEGVASSE
jgi:hypothetical protein